MAVSSKIKGVLTWSQVQLAVGLPCGWFCALLPICLSVGPAELVARL